MQNKNNITIRDIADRVGVSKTTISRYLNGKYQYMSKETQQRIKKEIECANFRPNKLANSLKTFKSGLIGLVLSDMTAVLAPYIIGSVSTTAAKHDKQLIRSMKSAWSTSCWISRWRGCSPAADITLIIICM